MNADHLNNYSSSQQTDINLVRIWLQVTTLSDLTDPERPYQIATTAYLDAQHPDSTVQSKTRPHQHQPTKSQVHLWERYISHVVFPYIYTLLVENIPSHKTTGNTKYSSRLIYSFQSLQIHFFRAFHKRTADYSMDWNKLPRISRYGVPFDRNLPSSIWHRTADSAIRRR